MFSLNTVLETNIKHLPFTNSR